MLAQISCVARVRNRFTTSRNTTSDVLVVNSLAALVNFVAKMIPQSTFFPFGATTEVIFTADPDKYEYWQQVAGARGLH